MICNKKYNSVMSSHMVMHNISTKVLTKQTQPMVSNYAKTTLDQWYYYRIREKCIPFKWNLISYKVNNNYNE